MFNQPDIQRAGVYSTHGTGCTLTFWSVLFYTRCVLENMVQDAH